MLRAKDEVIWGQTRFIFLGSALLFLINIYFGFDNALTVGQLPRWQALIHLHSGSIGWITLSQIGLAVWIFTGQRQVSAAYVRGVQALARIGLLAFAGYIISFGIAFSQRGMFFLLPLFGSVSMLVIWATAIFTLTQLRPQPVVTTVHILVAGGLLVAAVGATMGVLLGLERVIGQFLPIVGEDRVGVHAGMMDTYLLLVAAGIVEWFIQGDEARRWRWAGLVQAVAWTLAAILVSIAFLINGFEQLVPIFALLLLIGLLIFLARMGRKALAHSPLRAGVKAWGFFGTFWLIVFVGLFIYAAAILSVDPTALPTWFFAVFAHAGFVGMMTNLILGVFSARTAESRAVLPWGEPAACWLLNLGLLVFFALKIAADSRLGAPLMGIGVLLGLGTMAYRLISAASMRAARRGEGAVVGTD